MSKLKIVQYPHPMLRKKARAINKFDSRLQQLIDDMFECMYHHQGIGLAATQINKQLQLAVIDLQREGYKPLTMINPQVQVIDADLASCEEGCLSIPNIMAKIDRPCQIKLRALNRHGEKFEMIATELLATCIQHEYDHLNGVLFIDHLPPAKLAQIKKELATQSLNQ